MMNCHPFNVPTAVFAFALFSAVATPICAQERPESQGTFTLVRTFTVADLPKENYRSELFQKMKGPVTLPDAIDLNLQFSAEHGKPTIMPPLFAPQTTTSILRFPDGWLTTTMLRADGKGSFICRFAFKMVQPVPQRSDFDKYVDWCHGMLTSATLDPSLVTGH
jgi:hypothetical protein